MRRLMRAIGAVLQAGLLMVLVATIVLLALPRISSFDLLIVRGGSMEPTIHMGSAVLVDRSAELPAVGTVMTFRDPQQGVVTHRVVGVDHGLFTTKGDANSTADLTERSSSDMIGTARFSIPFLGYALYVVQQPAVFFLVLFATLGGLILGQLRDIRDQVHRIRGQRDAGPRADAVRPSPDA